MSELFRHRKKNRGRKKMENEIRKLLDRDYRKLCEDLNQLYKVLATRYQENHSYLQPKIASSSRFSELEMKRKYSR